MVEVSRESEGVDVVVCVCVMQHSTYTLQFGGTYCVYGVRISIYSTSLIIDFTCGRKACQALMGNHKLYKPCRIGMW